MNTIKVDNEELIRIKGGNTLKGTVRISGAKNAALPCMAASLLTDRYLHLSNVPRLKDVETMVQLLGNIGVNAEYADNSLLLKFDGKANLNADYEIVRKMRASILVLGPLLARFGYAKVSMPGGCSIGDRPIDLHLKALEKMGAQFELSSGDIIGKVKGRLKGAVIEFPKITVTGTENVMMAACLAEGRTVIKNAAKEPEVVDLANLLNKMGAKIKGAGTKEIVIEGVDYLKGASHTIIPDRIEAGTFAIIGGLLAESLIIENYPFEYLQFVDETLKKAGVNVVKIDKDKALIKKSSQIYPLDIETKEYPLFPTDLQAQMMVLLCFAKGTSTIKENIFENRFMHVPELRRMGAQIEIDKDNRVAKIHGIEKLEGTNVKATDLRASAAMVIAGLVAEGETVIEDVYHLRRGYEKIEDKLRTIGAEIEVITP